MYRHVLLMMCVGVGSATVASAGGDDTVKELAKARLELARRGMEALEKKLAAGAVSYPRAWQWSRRVLKSELALSANQADRIAALEAHVRRARRLEGIAREAFNRGAFSLVERLEAEYRRVSAELQLAEAKARKTAPRK